MKRRFDCMFLLPPELTGLAVDTCGVFRGQACHHNGSCGGRTKHTPASREALAQALEIVRARREKDSPLTPPAVL